MSVPSGRLGSKALNDKLKPQRAHAPSAAPMPTAKKLAKKLLVPTIFLYQFKCNVKTIKTIQ